MLNNVSMVGRITSDVKLNHTDGGTAVVDISIACQRERKEKDGGYKSDFASWKLLGNTAEFVAKYGGKGDLVSCEGKFRQDSWVGEDGKTKYRQYFVASSVHVLAKSKNAQSDTEDTSSPTEEATDISEDLPF